MIKRLVDRVFGAIAAPSSDDNDDRDAALRLATAVLLVDVARSDHAFDESEHDRVLDLIESHFDLTPREAAELFDAANEKADELVSAYDFTKILHEQLDENEKARIVALLWKVAYADGSLHAFEDSLVLKISDLLHVSRGRVMRLKHDAQLEAGASR